VKGHKEKTTMETIISNLRVIRACALKEIQTALAERGATLVGALRPVIFLVFMSLFAVSGSSAPTAVVMDDTGPYAQQFYTALAHSSSFRLQTASQAQAQELLKTGAVVTVVTIPADFDRRLERKQPVQVEVQINNLNTDFTNDIRRAVPLSITTFYGKAFPHLVTITPREHDVYAQQTDYFSYLTVSALVLALMVAGVLQAGYPAAAEWENATIKELLLSPANRLTIVIGKLLGSLVTVLLSAVVVLVILIAGLGVWPMYWGEALAFTGPCLLIFTTYGLLLGTLLKQRLTFFLVAFASTVPLYILSGAFGPLSFFGSMTSLPNLVAQLSPVYYAHTLMQHAFHGIVLNTFGVSLNLAILCGYTLLLLGVVALVLRHSTTAR
jgi:ABC-2 type transport system permease protein